MEAGKKNITEIFNRATKLQVPHFQRAYVWEEEQWSRYLDDMEYATKSNRNYFMGAVILKQQQTVVDQDHIRTIIDGQQRLTTTILFFKALYEAKGTPEKFKDVFTTFRGDIILVHNYSDRSIFEKVLSDKDPSSTEKKSKIYQCYKYFLENINPDRIDPNNLFSNILFVGIDLQQNEDEQQIFDTINSLGVRLTTAELLKNYLFNQNVDEYEKHWQSVFECDDETREYWDLDITTGKNTRSNIDVFLQSYLQIKIQDPGINVTAEDKLRFYKIESTFNSFKEFIANYHIDQKQIIRELKEYAENYRKIINPECTQQSIAKNNYIGRLNLVIFGLETATMIAYLLYVSMKQSDVNEKSAIFKYLESYIMRRMVCRSTSKNYNQLFRSLIGNESDTLTKLREFIEKKEEKVNSMPTDKDVATGFELSQLTNKQAKGVLYLIESAVRSERHATRLLDFNDYSLEHILPKKWRNRWGSEDLSEEDANMRDKILLTLGNLTLITSGLNSSISDSDWETKKLGSGSKLGLNEYAQGIETFSSYLSRETWDETVIRERAGKLAEFALNSVWNLD